MIFHEQRTAWATHLKQPVFWPAFASAPSAAEVGFRLGDKGTHTSRTLMLAELAGTLDAVSPGCALGGEIERKITYVAEPAALDERVEHILLILVPQFLNGFAEFL